MNIWIAILIGMGIGAIITPIILWIFAKIRNAFERRKIKRLMRKGEFLTPIDPKDFNVKAWKDKKYGNIALNPKDLENLNENIFKTKLIAGKNEC